MSEAILVMDDNKLNREMEAVFFAKEGFEVFRAANGKAGLEILKNKKIDLVILDLVMPELDGFTILNIMRNDPLMAKIPVVVLTGHDSVKEREEAMRTGANECYIKYNTSPEEIIKTVKRLLNK